MRSKKCRDLFPHQFCTFHMPATGDGLERQCLPAVPADFLCVPKQTGSSGCHPPLPAGFGRFLFRLNLKHAAAIFHQSLTWAEPGHKYMSIFYNSLLNDSYCMLALSIQTTFESMLRPLSPICQHQKKLLKSHLISLNFGLINRHYKVHAEFDIFNITGGALCWYKWHKYNYIGQQGTISY